jgi:hypothetical protein
MSNEFRIKFLSYAQQSPDIFDDKNQKMNRQTLLLFLFLILTGFSMRTQNLSKPILSELENVEKEMFTATSNGDSSAFRKICGNDYFTINANGESQNLEEAVLLSVRFKGSSVQLSEQSNESSTMQRCEQAELNFILADNKSPRFCIRRDGYIGIIDGNLFIGKELQLDFH